MSGRSPAQHALRFVQPRRSSRRRARVGALMCVVLCAVLCVPTIGAVLTATPASASGNDDTVYAFGSASFRGSTSGMRLAEPIVAMAPTANGSGYWLVADDGGIFSFGAPFYGSLGNLRLAQPIVGMTATPSGRGYWLVAR